MKDKSYLDTLNSVILKILLVVALFFPVSTTMAEAKHQQYFQEFLLVNAVAAVFIFFYIIALIFKRRWNRENLAFCVKFLIALCGYQIFYWLMQDSIQWEWEGWNCLVSFGMFLLLMCGQNREWFDRHHIIEFANRSIVLSNLIAIAVYLLGYSSVYWYNFQFELVRPRDFYGEARFEWIYYHKSQYAFMLLLSLAFILVHRKKFINKITFAISVAILMAALYISHVNTAIVGGGLILAAFCVDLFVRNFRKIRLWIRVIVIPLFSAGVIGACVMAFQKIAAERSILTLGSRTFIWDHVMEFILQHPEGIGNAFAKQKIFLTEMQVDVNNGHNIFLNEMLRFSIPVGICFIIFFVLILSYSMEKRFSFLTLGIWGALLMSMMMDYVVMSSGWTLMLFFFYTIFFLDVCAGKGADPGSLPKAAKASSREVPEDIGKAADGSPGEKPEDAAEAADGSPEEKPRKRRWKKQKRDGGNKDKKE